MAEEETMVEANLLGALVDSFRPLGWIFGG